MREVDRFYADNMFHGYVQGLELTEGTVIIDLGTYKGYTAKLLSTLYCNTKVYTFEPMIPFYNEAVTECKSHPNITVLPYGLGNGNFDFNMNINADSTSMIQNTNSDNSHKCVMRDFFDFLNKNNITNIDLLHINIEGAEYELLDYLFAKNFHLKIKHLIIQFHYPNPINDAKLERYYNILDKTHKQIYDYRYVWTRWSLK
jgi:FkbM family methyltransferase